MLQFRHFPSAPRPAQRLPVFEAHDLRVVSGANHGDTLSFADELDLGDIYELGARARTRDLCLVMNGTGPFSIGAGSELGRPGGAVHLDSCLTLMAISGAVVEVLVFVETDTEGCVVGLYAMPLAPMAGRAQHALLRIDRDSARARYAQTLCATFARGTRIAMASGEQVPVEALGPGDMVLTRDEGPQPLRWRGDATLRAFGDFAPVRIAAGALANTGDLVVNPDQRLFIHKHAEGSGPRGPEVLMRARHLVNGDSVRIETGGHVDYVQLLFDRQQTIYAEGIAVETMLREPRIRPGTPDDQGPAPQPTKTGCPRLDPMARPLC